MGRTDEGAKRSVTRRSRQLVVRCARCGAVFRDTGIDTLHSDILTFQACTQLRKHRINVKCQMTTE